MKQLIKNLKSIIKNLTELAFIRVTASKRNTLIAVAAIAVAGALLAKPVVQGFVSILALVNMLSAQVVGLAIILVLGCWVAFKKRPPIIETGLILLAEQLLNKGYAKFATIGGLGYILVIGICLAEVALVAYVGFRVPAILANMTADDNNSKKSRR